MGPSEGRRSAPANPGVTPEGRRKDPGTGSAGKAARSAETRASAATVGTSAVSGPMGPSEGRPSTSASSGGPSGSTRPIGCHKCGKRGHYRVNCLVRAKTGSKSKDTKRKRSRMSGQTAEGKQAKTEAPASSEATKYKKPAFSWSQVTLVILKSDGQPMSLDEYEEEKGNFVLKEVELAEKDGSMIDIDEWSWFQDRVEVKFSNVASTETFRKLMVNRSIISKAKWEEEHL